jgi:hypothetical protein
MGAARLASTDIGLGHASARLPVRKAARAWRGERSAKRLRVAIVLALFVALVAVALLVGRAVIAPVLQPGAGGRGGARDRLFDARWFILPAAFVRQRHRSSY